MAAGALSLTGRGRLVWVGVAGLLAVLIAVVLLTTGDDPERITRTADIPLEQAPDGKLRRPPSPLTLRDVSEQPRGSAQQAFMLLWFEAQWGSTNVYSMYDTRVRRALGVEAIVGAYAEIRAIIAATRPRIVATRRTPQGTRVYVELLSAAARPQAESFLFRRNRGTWQVRHDTYLASILPEYVRRNSRGGATPRATAAGLRAARRYRRLFLPRRPRREANAEDTGPQDTGSPPGAASPQGAGPP